MDQPVTVLFPMVTTLDELHTARHLLAEAAAEVGCPPGELPSGFEVGVMIEVPALALEAAALAPHVDLFSIGTNDLTQYTLAAERGNPAVAHLADPLHPAVLRLIAGVTKAAGSRVRVAVCGEIGSDTAATPLLLGLGVHELSMSPPAIPAVKHAVRSLSAKHTRVLAHRALDQHTASDVRALIDAPTAG
jgi:phosphocarrier protein FPr